MAIRWRKDAFFSCGEEGEPYHPAGFGPNATVGVGFDFQDGSIFFTLNGQFLGDAFEHARHRPTVGAEGALHAAVALHEPGDSARFNLGQERFAFDLEALALARQRTRAVELEACLTPGMLVLGCEVHPNAGVGLILLAVSLAIGVGHYVIVAGVLFSINP